MWEELYRASPKDQKVILTVRDSDEKWWSSWCRFNDQVNFIFSTKMCYLYLRITSYYMIYVYSKSIKILNFNQELRRSAVGGFNIIQPIVYKAGEAGYMGPKENFIIQRAWSRFLIKIVKLYKLQAMFKAMRIIVSRYLRLSSIYPYVTQATYSVRLP